MGVYRQMAVIQNKKFLYYAEKKRERKVYCLTKVNIYFAFIKHQDNFFNLVNKFFSDYISQF